MPYVSLGITRRLAQQVRRRAAADGMTPQEWMQRAVSTRRHLAASDAAAPRRRSVRSDARRRQGGLPRISKG